MPAPRQAVLPRGSAAWSRRIRDPDRSVIEIDAYAGEEPETRGGGKSTGYEAHP